jgi:hypothetical protein
MFAADGNGDLGVTVTQARTLHGNFSPALAAAWSRGRNGSQRIESQRNCPHALYLVVGMVHEHDGERAEGCVCVWGGIRVGA